MFRPSSFPQIPHWTLIITSDLFKPVQVPRPRPGLPFSFDICGIRSGLLRSGVKASPGRGSAGSGGDAEQGGCTLCSVTAPGADPAQLPRLWLRGAPTARGTSEPVLQAPAGAVPAPGADPGIPRAHSELKTIQTLCRVILGSFQTSSHQS